jgi:prolipoprotein diacylglyceryltransferase
MHYIESLRHDTPDTIIDGLGAISLFVFSASVMAFLFFYHPVRLLIENQKQEALTFFTKTVAIFGVTTALILVLASLQ